MNGKNLIRSLMITVLAAGLSLSWSGIGSAFAQAPAPAAQASPWKDRAEYDQFTAILAAAQKNDNNQVIELTDKYLAGYPDSKQLDKIYALRLQAYQGMNNAPKMEETANKLLEIDPNNLRALILLSYLFPRTVNTADPDLDKKADKAAELAKKGLDALNAMPKPDPKMSDEDFQKQKDQSGAVLHETAGFAALQKKDYPTAQQELTKAVTANPNDALGFYWLGLAYVSEKPDTKYDKAMWAMARATTIQGQTALPESMKGQVKDYLAKVYDARHGSDEGLDDVVAKAGQAPFPPDDFHVKTAEEIAPPEPEPVAAAPAPKRELTVKPEELTDFSVIVKYLQAGGDKEADTWELLKGQEDFALPGKVVSATPAAKPTKVLIAVSPELQTPAGAGKHDVELTLAAPYSKALPAGTAINFTGTIDAYTSKPFVLKMTNGKIQ